MNIKKILIYIITIIVLLTIIISVYWIKVLNTAHSTFENYYTFRGCIELIQKTDTYGLCKLKSGEIIKIVAYNNKWFLDGDLPIGAIISTTTSATSTSTTTNSQIDYKNTEYGFTFSLPISWEEYSIIKTNWQGSIIDSTSSQKVNGAEIIIRHPLWTTENPRQDIPIMIFTLSEWDLVKQEKISASAAPIGPSELGRNSKYVFALPARYNFAFLTGFEEIQKIIESNPLKSI